ncbi:transposase [Mycobacterium sp. pUA109]|uniref:transposase n=1 Tax=Mycobacterium sp. pUA109 TaxID=3238982 RepID=UPI00351BBCEB
MKQAHAVVSTDGNKPTPSQTRHDQDHQLNPPRNTRRTGRTGPTHAALWRRHHDVLAYFDHHACNGPTEAINGRLEALCCNALRFHNLTHDRTIPTPLRAASPNESIYSKTGRTR